MTVVNGMAVVSVYNYDRNHGTVTDKDGESPPAGMQLVTIEDHLDMRIHYEREIQRLKEGR